MARVSGIYVSATAGADLCSVPEAVLEAGRGLVGDRYYQKIGTFSEKLKDKDDWQATLIELEEIQRFNTAFTNTIDPGKFRRNIVTTGVRLNEFVGARFAVGAAVVEGMRLCEPCAYLGQLLGPEIVKGMVHRAGLRVRILTGAIVRPGDRISTQVAGT